MQIPHYELGLIELSARLPDDIVSMQRLNQEARLQEVGRRINDAVRQALGCWVSELEPVLQFRAGEIYPFGITAKGHMDTYVAIFWRKTDDQTTEAYRNSAANYYD